MLKEMMIDIDALTETELRDLNHRIVERIRLIQQMKAHKAMMNFSVGEKVKFRATSGEIIRGIITRYNRKTVSVITNDHRQWNVSPTFIERDAIDTEQETFQTSTEPSVSMKLNLED